MVRRVTQAYSKRRFGWLLLSYLHDRSTISAGTTTSTDLLPLTPSTTSSTTAVRGSANTTTVGGRSHYCTTVTTAPPSSFQWPPQQQQLKSTWTSIHTDWEHSLSEGKIANPGIFVVFYYYQSLQLGNKLQTWAPAAVVHCCHFVNHRSLDLFTTTTPPTTVPIIRQIITNNYIRHYSSSCNVNSSRSKNSKMSLDNEVEEEKRIQDMRTPYRVGSDTFDLDDLVSRNPMAQFEAWFQEACKHQDIVEPNAIALATASSTGQPSVRMLLLKGLTSEGFIFYTNFGSRKAQELKENPFCSLCVHWEPLNRSVRVEGKVSQLPEAESTEYFQSRPRASQIGAIASKQSTVIPSRKYLMEAFSECEKKYEEEECIPKPEFWGGYLIEPDVIEFWQGQTTRLHDRLRFRKRLPEEVLDPELSHEGEDDWIIERLSP